MPALLTTCHTHSLSHTRTTYTCTHTQVVLAYYFGKDVTKKAQAALIAKYLQRELHCLQLTDDEAIFRGNIKFSGEPFEPFLAELEREKEAGGKNGAKGGPAPKAR